MDEHLGTKAMHPEAQGLEQLYRDDGQSVPLRQYEIIRLWEMGLFNDVAYLYLLLRYEFRHGWKDRLESTGGDFDLHVELTAADIDYIIHEWRGTTPKNDKGDVKELTYDKLTKALATMHSKEACIASTRQLSLSFSDELGMGV